MHGVQKYVKKAGTLFMHLLKCYEKQIEVSYHNELIKISNNNL